MTGQSKKKKLDCQICGKIVTHMKRHMEVHIELKPFRCENCGKSFKSKRELKQHHQKVHTEVKKTECLICAQCSGRDQNVQKVKR